jgi:hypothetical protein
MTEPFFDHERLDVYRIAKSLNGAERHALDQWLRTAQSIPLNIAEGNGKQSLNTRIIRSDRSSTSTSTAMLSTSTRKRTNKALDRSARSARSDMVTFSPRTRSMRLIVADT